MKKLLLAVLFLPLTALAVGRSLPSGESRPNIIIKIFNSPIGEFHLLESDFGRTTAVLRSNVGEIGSLQEIRGPLECDEWLIDRKDALPRGCSFVFYFESKGTYTRVNSEELEETNIFQSIRGTLRGKHVTL